MVSRNFQQTICTVPRLDMTAIQFDRLDYVAYDLFNTGWIQSEEELTKFKSKLTSFTVTQEMEFSDRQIQQFVDAWNTADARPLAPYGDTWYGSAIKEATDAILKDIPPMRCPDNTSNFFYEITPAICKQLIDYLSAKQKENNYKDVEAQFNNSVSADLFDFDEVYQDGEELVRISQMIRTLKRIQKSDFNKTMSYIYIS